MKNFEVNYNPNIRPLLKKIPVYIIKLPALFPISGLVSRDELGLQVIGDRQGFNYRHTNSQGCSSAI